MKNFKTIKTVLSYLKKYWFLIIISLLFAAGSVLLSLYIPILVGDGIDLIISENNVDFEKLLPILTNVGIIALLVGALQWLMNVINNRITYKVTKDIRNRAFDKIKKLPLSYVDSCPSGEIVNKIISDVDQFADVSAKGILPCDVIVALNDKEINSLSDLQGITKGEFLSSKITVWRAPSRITLN